MLRLLKNTFSTAVHRASDIIKNVRTIFETSGTQLLNALRGKVMPDGSSRNGSGEKIPFDPGHREQFLIKLPVIF